MDRKKVKGRKRKKGYSKRLFLDGEKFLKFGKEKTLIYKKSALTKGKRNKQFNNSVLSATKDIKKLIEGWYKDTLNIYLRRKIKFF